MGEKSKNRAVPTKGRAWDRMAKIEPLDDWEARVFPEDGAISGLHICSGVVFRKKLEDGTYGFAGFHAHPNHLNKWKKLEDGDYSEAWKNPERRRVLKAEVKKRLRGGKTVPRKLSIQMPAGQFIRLMAKHMGGIEGGKKPELLIIPGPESLKVSNRSVRNLVKIGEKLKGSGLVADVRMRSLGKRGDRRGAGLIYMSAKSGRVHMFGAGAQMKEGPKELKRL